MNHRKRILAILAAAFCSMTALPTVAKTQTTPAIPANEEADLERRSPLADRFDSSLLNPDYLEWLKNPEGEMPPYFSTDYLSESYAKAFQSASKSRQTSLKAIQSLPEKLDLRDEGRALRIFDQGNYGICWSVSAVQTAADLLYEQEPGLELSPLHLAWFTFKGDQEEAAYSALFPNADPYTVGGNDNYAVATLASWSGPVLEERLPFEKAEEIPDDALENQADFHLQDAYSMPSSFFSDQYMVDNYHVSDLLTKTLIYENGPVTVQYYAPASADTFNEETNAMYNPEGRVPNHAVQLIGWDDSYSRENFLEGKRPEHDGAWLVRNSWGRSWGDDGYFWLSYEEPTIRNGTQYLLEDKDNYQTNYQYDRLGWCFLVDPSSDPADAGHAKGANIFTAQSDEQLEAVSFYTTDANTNYTIDIYTEVEEGQPESGKLVHRQSGNEFYAGYHTIELSKAIALEAGKNFSIVVTFDNENGRPALPVEMYQFGPDGEPNPVIGTGNESFAFDSSAEEWVDVYGSAGSGFWMTNICIKGFTNPLPDSNVPLANVRFSEMEGEVDNHTLLTLSNENSLSMVYTIDGQEEREYTSPIELSFSDGVEEHVIRAWSVDEYGNTGNPVERHYTQAQAQIYEILLEHDSDTITLDPTLDEQEIELPNVCGALSFRVISADQITVDGKSLTDWRDRSAEISLAPGEIREVDIVGENSGRLPKHCRVRLKRSPLSFDYEQETISFDSVYEVMTQDGQTITSGQSITDLIEDETDVPLLVSWNDEDGNSQSETYTIPGRPRIGELTIDFEAEMTEDSFRSIYLYSTNPDMTDAQRTTEGQKLALTPGVDLYVQRLPDNSFRSVIEHLVVPERPDAPELSLEEKTSSTLSFTAQDGVVYGLIETAVLEETGDDALMDLAWTLEPVFTGLKGNTDYTLIAFVTAGNDHFSSETSKAVFTTSPDVDLLDVVYRKILSMDSSEFESGFEDELLPSLIRASEILVDRSTAAEGEAVMLARELNRILLEMRLEPDRDRLDTIEIAQIAQSE